MSMLLAQDSTEEVAQSASELFATFVDALPRVGIAVLVAIVAWLIGRGVRWLARRLLLRTNTNSFATVMSKLIGWIITTIGVLLALAVTFPSVKPVDVLAGLGFFSVALGFAFQDILQNLLAGVLLLFRDPFAAGDQIQVL
ncbi:MAG: mechanosensitive ion channel family protein, partial [Egibacteraceae bacterium]